MQIERRLSKARDSRALSDARALWRQSGRRARRSLAYFGKEPRRLTVAEAALLVALPQLPERRRPDRNPTAAEAARERVLDRMAVAGRARRRRGGAGRGRRRCPPAGCNCPHLPPMSPDAALRKEPAAPASDDAEEAGPAALEAVAREAAHEARSEALACHGDGGCADRRDRRRGRLGRLFRCQPLRLDRHDAHAIRSPGSTLKPFIYGLAFEQGWSPRRRSSRTARPISSATGRAIST